MFKFYITSLGCNVAYGLLHKIPTKTDIIEIPTPESLPESVIASHNIPIQPQNSNDVSANNTEVVLDAPKPDTLNHSLPNSAESITEHDTAVETKEINTSEPNTTGDIMPKVNLPRNYSTSQPDQSKNTVTLPPAATSQINVSQSMDLEALKKKQQSLRQQLQALNQSMNS